MLRRLIGLISIVVIMGLAAALIVAGRFDRYLNSFEATDRILEIAGQGLLMFLAILIVRYLALLICSAIEIWRYTHRAGRPESYPSITLIMPAMNEGPVIESAIRSAMTLDYPNFEVIVVDDGSTDDTYEQACKLADEFGEHRLRVFTQANRGKAGALNVGIAHARGELVLCSDADSRLSPESLWRMARHFEDPAVSAVAGNVRVVNRHNPLTKLQALEYVEGLNLTRTAQALFGCMMVIPGPCGMFRRSVLNAVGGYLSDTFAEDCDLTLRLVVAGGQIRYEPAAIAYTEAPEHLRPLFRQRYRWGRGILQALIKHRSELLRPWNFRVWFLLSSLAFESVVLPTLNLLGVVLLVITTLGGISSLGLLWWAALTMLDMAVALYCVAREREQLRLVFYAVIYRLFFVLYVDTVRFFAWVDEMFDVRMSWMRLARLGRI